MNLWLEQLGPESSKPTVGVPGVRRVWCRAPERGILTRSRRYLLVDTRFGLAQVRALVRTRVGRVISSLRRPNCPERASSAPPPKPKSTRGLSPLRVGPNSMASAPIFAEKRIRSFRSREASSSATARNLRAATGVHLPNRIKYPLGIAFWIHAAHDSGTCGRRAGLANDAAFRRRRRQ